jgi:hypothetical protein
LSSNDAPVIVGRIRRVCSCSRRVDDDPVQPGERRRIASKRIPPAKRVEERVLHDVLGFVADVARRNGTQLPLGVLVRVHHRVVQGASLRLRSDDGRDD